MEDDIWSLYTNFFFAELIYLVSVHHFLKPCLIAESSPGIQGDIAWIGGRRRGRIDTGGNCRQEGRTCICSVRWIRDVEGVCVGGMVPGLTWMGGRKFRGRFVCSK
jgi:hypothetical protein